MDTSGNKDKEYYIKLYEEEAQANLNLYISGKDDTALQRYNYLMYYVKSLRSQ